MSHEHTRGVICALGDHQISNHQAFVGWTIKRAGTVRK